MLEINDNNIPNKLSFEDALNLTGRNKRTQFILGILLQHVLGLGKYNYGLLFVCCLLILAMYIDIFGFSVVLPSVACDMGLSTSEQGLLSAIPLIGVMISSYAWGLCADTLGRRLTLLLAMPIGMVLNLAASIAPSYISLAVLKFFSASFTSSANAAGFVLVGESVPARVRGKFMLLMASATMYVQFVICVIALPITHVSFSIDVPWLSMTYRPWRLLLQIISLPGIIGVIGSIFVLESPKFLISKGKEESSIEILKTISKWNTGASKKPFSVESIFVEELEVQDSTKKSVLVKIWNQTAPLFKPPLLKNSLILYYILLCAYMTSTGYTMWVPTMTNAFFIGEENAGKTLCEVASTAATASNSTTAIHCDNIIKPMTLYAVICYSGISGTLNILLTFVVGPLGKKRTTILVFSIALICGVALIFVRIPIMSIGLFFVFLYVAHILGNVNTYLVELNPTYLRGMATCLSVVVARGFGFFSIQLIASLLANYCTSMISGYVLLVFSGLVVTFFLPPDTPQDKNKIKSDPSKGHDRKRTKS